MFVQSGITQKLKMPLTDILHINFTYVFIIQTKIRMQKKINK